MQQLEPPRHHVIEPGLSTGLMIDHLATILKSIRSTLVSFDRTSDLTATIRIRSVRRHTLLLEFDSFPESCHRRGQTSLA